MTTMCTMELGYVMKSDFYNLPRNSCLGLWRDTHSLRRNTATTKKKKSGEIILRFQKLHPYFYHMICTNNCYYFGTNDTICKYSYLYPHRQ